MLFPLTFECNFEGLYLFLLLLLTADVMTFEWFKQVVYVQERVIEINGPTRKGS